MPISVLGASQPGNTQADRTEAAENEAREKRLKEENEIANASGNQPMSTDYIKRFYAYMKNETQTPKNQPQPKGNIYDTRKTPRTDSPSKPKGGKSRKHRGSRKNKKSRRR